MFVRIAAFTVIVLGPWAAQAEPIYLNQGDWEVTQSPEELGYSTEGLAEAEELIASGNTTCVLATVGDDLLYLYGDPEKVSYIASVRKSVIAILYGKYVKDGTIDLDATLEDLEIDDVQGLLPIEKKAKVRHLISATSGVYHPASNSGDSTDFAPDRGSVEPGTYYLYNNWDFNAAGTVLEKTTGKSIYDIYDETLAQPLGFQDFNRKRHRRTGNKDASEHLAYHFHVSTRDLARIGYLMLRDGEWYGDRIVDKDWVEEIRSTVTPLEKINPENTRDRGFAYGYLWWIYAGNDPALEGAYAGTGYFGHFIMVIPRLDMVISHKTAPTPKQLRDNHDNHAAISVSLNDFLDIARAIVAAKNE